MVVLIKMKIENMREQHTAIVGERRTPLKTASKPKKEKYGIVTVAMGEGISGIVPKYWCTDVIEGGQTMNPSTEDIVKAVRRG